jgi:GntR family transcriptional repressor for pyruvate dehydrogenase complex
MDLQPAMISAMPASRQPEAAVIPTYEPDPSGNSSAMTIAAQLREAIIHDYGDAELIGSEEELISRFGVSRPTMRQAVRIVQAEGLVTVRRGPSGGMFARVPETSTVTRSLSLLLRHRGATFRQVLDALGPLSSALARSAARHPDPAARAAAADRILAFQPPDELDETSSILLAARYFGAEIDELVANPILALLGEILMDLALNGIVDGPFVGISYEAARSFHCAIADTIRDGDEEAAVALSDAMFVQLHQWSG